MCCLNLFSCPYPLKRIYSISLPHSHHANREHTIVFIWHKLPQDETFISMSKAVNIFRLLIQRATSRLFNIFIRCMCVLFPAFNWFNIHVLEPKEHIEARKNTDDDYWSTYLAITLRGRVHGTVFVQIHLIQCEKIFFFVEFDKFYLLCSTERKNIRP